MKTIFKILLADSKRYVKECATLEEAKRYVKEQNELAQMYKFVIVHGIKREMK
jgi:RNase P subunit RPR2